MPITRQCVVCSTEFEARRPDALYCSPAHRSKAHRQRKKTEAQASPPAAGGDTPHSPSTESPATSSSLLDQTVVELAAVGLAASAAGLGVIALALRIDHPHGETGSSLVSLVREHRLALREVLATATASSGDEVDEVNKKREEKRRAAGYGS